MGHKTVHTTPDAEPANELDSTMSIADVQEMVGQITVAIESVIEGKSAVIQTAIVVMLSDGHLLIEDVPGVGKTKLARALAGAIDGTVRRVQFTPDLLPTDLTGVSIYNQETRTFEFKPGPIFANLVVGDEINRASPKTQSALLECMEEHQVTVDGDSLKLDRPFMVVATQNPIEMEGTYPLPEAQRDRFMAQVSMGYPNAAAEMAMLDLHGDHDPLDTLLPVCTAKDVAAMIHAVRKVYVAEGIRRYVVQLAEFTRAHPSVRLGASPRASLQLLRAAKAKAVLAGRHYALPDDIQELAGVIWPHRLLLTSQGQSARQSAGAIIAEAIKATPVPTPRN